MRGFLWWIDRWRKSTAYVDMTLEEQAAYRNLLDEIALRDGEIPDDERVLARACGDPLRWKRVRATVLRWLRRTEGGWTNDTALEVLGASRRRAEKQRRYRSRRGGGGGGGPGPPGNEPGNARGNGAGNAGGNEPGNPGGYKDPDPDPEDPSLRSGSPTPAEVRACGASSATEQTPARSHSPRRKGRSGKGSGPSAAIDYDETDALQVEVAAYCERLAQLDADANGGGPASAHEIRQVLKIVSTTPQGQHLSGLRNASRSWLETTLETCRRFEGENYG